MKILDVLERENERLLEPLASPILQNLEENGLEVPNMFFG